MKRLFLAICLLPILLASPSLVYSQSEETNLGWIYKGKILHPQCFKAEWSSSDNLQEFYEQFMGITENYYDTNEFNDFRENLGDYWGKHITSFEPIRASWGEDIELAVSMDSCLAKKSKNFGSRDGMITSSEARDEYAYKIIKEISSNDCQNLAPNIKGTCIKSYELRIYDWGGGSSGHWLTNQIYGLFRLSNNSEYIFPLGEES
jgi:hypothetical protein